jgi:hypothetical protein
VLVQNKLHFALNHIWLLSDETTVDGSFSALYLRSVWSPGNKQADKTVGNREGIDRFCITDCIIRR